MAVLHYKIKIILLQTNSIPPHLYKHIYKQLKNLTKNPTKMRQQYQTRPILPSTLYHPLLCMLVLALASTCSCTVFKRVNITNNADALCLDGSPADYYVADGDGSGSRADPLKFIIYFGGQDWCKGPDINSTIQACYLQSKTEEGSSKSWPDKLDIQTGILSNSTSNYFANYTKVLFKSCDGAGHQGFRKSAISYKGDSIYFKGHTITQSRLEDLESNYKLFSKATQIYVGGDAAGGIAALQWINNIKNKARATTIAAVIDSAIFLDSQSLDEGGSPLRTELTNLLKLTNTQITSPCTECAASYPDNQVSCMFVQYLYKFLSSPIFFVQSLYNPDAIAEVLNIKCINGHSLQPCTSSEMTLIEGYHKNLTALLNILSNTSGAGTSDNGVWAIACVADELISNVYYNSVEYRVPMAGNVTIQSAVNSWAKRERVSHRIIDGVNWPNNLPCNGMKDSNNIINTEEIQQTNIKKNVRRERVSLINKLNLSIM